jgi:hypothetical protein
MNKGAINQDAWDILNADEKAAISLSLGHGKSTWESGEIMKRAHFKYLEISKRAMKFLEIFTNHFELYNGLFPEEVQISFAFKEYLTLTIIERKHISKAVKQMENSAYSIASQRTKLVIKEIENLQKNNNPDAAALYSIIMDFDRWNNFRILPMAVQEPSAFKRRNKARNVKHLKKMIALPEYSVMLIIKRYTYSGKYPKIYLPLISSYLDDNYRIVAMRNKSSTINDLTKAGLFIFPSRAKADEFGGLVAGYFVDNIKNCKTGQKFWPEFRLLIAEAINYKELENIHKSRTYLDWALFDKDKELAKKKKKEKVYGEARVTDDKSFYRESK